MWVLIRFRNEKRKTSSTHKQVEFILTYAYYAYMEIYELYKNHTTFFNEKCKIKAKAPDEKEQIILIPEVVWTSG